MITGLYCVYKHTAPNGKVYIGITSQSIKNRFRNGKGYSHNDHFRRAIEQYSWKQICHEVLIDGCGREQAMKEEARLIKLYHADDPLNGYNLMSGDGGFGGHSPETIRKLQLINTGKKRTAESIEKQRQSILGHTLSESSKEKLRTQRMGTQNPMYGKKHTKESIMKIKSNAVVRSGGQSNLAKQVDKYDLRGNYICTYEAITTAANENGIPSPYNISASINGRQKTCGGYIWRYAEGANH